MDLAVAKWSGSQRPYQASRPEAGSLSYHVILELSEPCFL
jgi:hypothetical protein